MYPWDGKNIYLIGFMATGKSKVGKEIAYFLGRPFFDTDDLVEEIAGKRISEIFAHEGEQTFRDLESKAVNQISQTRECVVALGGGAVLRQENWALLASTGIIICLYADEQTLLERISIKSHRPLMHSESQNDLLSKIRALLTERQPVYDRADYCFKSRQDVSAQTLAKQIFYHLQEEL